MSDAWPKMKLSDAGVTLLDCDHKTPDAVDVGRPYIGIPQMTSGRIDFSTARQISEADFITWNRKTKYQRNDVVLSRRTNPGVTAIDDTGTEFALGQNLVLLRANGKRVDPPFLRWLVKTPEWWEQIEKFMNVGAVFSSLRCRDVPSFELTIPPLPEQRAIAATLGALDDKIELNRKMNATLEAMARALFRDWFVDFGPTRAKMARSASGAKNANEPLAPYLSPDLWPLFPDRLNDEGKPEGWEVDTLGSVATAKNEGVDPSAINPDTPYIGLEHMPRGSIALNDWEGAGKVSSNKAAFAVGDFLFGKLRPYFHKVGIAPVSGICSTDIVVVRPKAEAWAGFVIACISDEEFVAYTDKTSTGTKMPRTSWSIMAKYPVVLPPLKLAQAFNETVAPMFERIRANIHESRTLAQTRDLLLPRLMSGELRVAESEALASEVA